MQRILWPSFLALFLLTPATTSAAPSCTIVYRLETNVRVGSIGWKTDYTNAPGVFVGDGAAVDCHSLSPNVWWVAGNDDDSGHRLILGLTTSKESLSRPTSSNAASKRPRRR